MSNSYKLLGQGVPTMRPIMKTVPSVTPVTEETLAEGELLDVVPERMSSSLRGHKSRSDTKHRRVKETSQTTLGTKNKKKGSKLSLEMSVPSVMETESTTGKRRQSIDRMKKRRTSKDTKKGHQRFSDEDNHREDKSHVGGESGAETTEIKDETKGTPSSPDIGDGMSFGDLSRAGLHTGETQAPSIDSWRIHFPDETAKIVMKHGNHYEGRISRKLMEGNGIFTWADGAQYNGEFVGGEMMGRGRLLWPDMSRYEGDFVKGWRYGKGLYVASYKKMAYVGDWVAGRKHGSGLIFYNEQGTNMYDGEWDNDLRQGYGLRVYLSGARYLGDWRQGLRDGNGTMLFANGDVYSGNWEQGLMSGFGEYIWAAFLNHSLSCFGDNVYSGWFEKGIRQGVATYQLKGGQQIYGEWCNDIKEGRAKVVCGDGSVYIGNPMFDDDRPATRKIENMIKVSSDLTPVTTKALPTVNQRYTKGKAEMLSLQRRRKKRETEAHSNTGLVFKAPPPDPNLIMHGHHLPLYASFQRINLRYHLDLLKTLKHPQEATGSQTDDITFLNHSSTDCDQIPEEAGSNQKIEEVIDLETKVKLKIKQLPNEQSTQTEDGVVEPLTLLPPEEENTQFPIGNSKPYQTKKQQDNSFLKAADHVAKLAKILPIKNPKVKSHRRRQHDRRISNKPPGKWPVWRKVSYPGGQTENTYEEKWLRLTLTRHLPAIRLAYDEYARVACESSELATQPCLMRAMLWQFYRDCKITSRVSLVELDQLMASNPLTQVADPHYPFERIQIWQFLYSLIDVAWTLYASKGIGHPGSRGVLGSAFDKLMYDDVLPRPGEHIGSVFFEHRDLLPLAPVYMLYKSLGEPLSATRLLRQICCRTGVEPEKTKPRAVAHYPDFITNGTNAFVLGGDLTFLPQKPPLSCVEKPSYEMTSETTLTIFRNVGVDGLTNILVEVCPSIKVEGVIVNMGYTMTFLEFYEVLIKCESRSHLCEERRLARLAALEKFRLEREVKQSIEEEKSELSIVLSNKSGKTKQKKMPKTKA